MTNTNPAPLPSIFDLMAAVAAGELTGAQAGRIAEALPLARIDVAYAHDAPPVYGAAMVPRTNASQG